MDIKTLYPDYAVIEAHIQRARLERSLAVSQMIVSGLEAIGRGVKSLVASIGRGVADERDRRAIEADAFLKRSVPRY